jgi:hypothetical protein
MKPDHPPIIQEEKEPSTMPHMDDTIGQHGAGHLPHHNFFKAHSAGHKLHHENVKAMCGGGMSKGKKK